MELEFFFVLALLLVLIYYIRILPRKEGFPIFESTVSPFYDEL